MKLLFKFDKCSSDEKIYRLNDGSFGPKNNVGLFQITLNDNSTFLLNIDKHSKLALSFEGYFPVESIKNLNKFNFNPSNIYEGEIILEASEEEFDGDGFFMPLKNQKLSFDEKKSVLAIGEISNTKCMRFSDWAYAYLSDEKIVGFALKLFK